MALNWYKVLFEKEKDKKENMQGIDTATCVKRTGKN